MSLGVFVSNFLRKLSAIVTSKSHRWSFHVGSFVSIVLVALWINSSPISSATAQTPPATGAAEPEEVVYGRPGQGQITDSDFQHEWLFLPNSKDRITIGV